jgi:hypothetical protein
MEQVRVEPRPTNMRLERLGCEPMARTTLNHGLTRPEDEATLKRPRSCSPQDA